MKILLIGGTGVMGVSLSRLLIKKGYDVYVTSRRDRKDAEGVHYIKCNVKEENGIYLLSEYQWDVIVDFMMYYTEEFEKLYPRYLDMTSHYIFLSSARVYAESDKKLNEDSSLLLDVCGDKEYLLTKDYALEKARQERIIVNSTQKQWTIIRPYITFGHNRLQLGIWEKENWLYRFLNNRTIVISKDIIDKKTTLTHADDVANYILSIIEKKTYGEIYQVISDNEYTWREVIDMYTECLESITGKKLKLKITESVYDVGINNPFFQYEFDRKYNRIFDNEKIKKMADDYDGENIKKSIINELEYITDRKEFLPIDWRREAYLDRITKEKASRKEIGNFITWCKYTIYRLGLK